MLWLKSLVSRWTTWVGDRDVELALRRKLTQRGYYGDAATFDYMRLVAVQRPGWLQVFSFVVNVKHRDTDEHERLFGLLRQDERYNRLEVEFFENSGPRQRLFREWSADLVVLRNPRL
ncbi:MAG TPA: hypothetical protein DDW52_03440 [Planctomycetaceae bacterium]|nr:hypothetical protein [Planctomycetaceae bacterium]